MEIAGPVVVSSGFNRTHMTIAAREANERGLLSIAITGAYPTVRLKHVLRRLKIVDSGRVARLVERDERIPEAQLKAQFLPELLDEAARLLLRVPGLRRAYPLLSVTCMWLYGRRAARQLARISSPPSIYHFRAGFGHRSLVLAKCSGLVTLCDHSAPHPSFIDELVGGHGKLGRSGEVRPQAPRHPLWRAMLSDIDKAEHVLVNSDMLKETFVSVGWNPDYVHVLYLGVDDHFLTHAAGAPRMPNGGALRLIFAGRFEPAKGADVLRIALKSLEVDWELVIAGAVSVEASHHFAEFLADRRVNVLGTIDRAELARRMRRADVFVFPSFAEGSARVVFEALACGCYVITTPNAGSIVEDGVHGALVEPGEAEPLTAAIMQADCNRPRVSEIGNRNADLIATRFRQVDYGDSLADLYAKLAGPLGPHPDAGSLSRRKGNLSRAIFPLSQRPSGSA